MATPVKPRAPRTAHPLKTIKTVGELVRSGIKQKEISERTGVPIKTIKQWAKDHEWKPDLVKKIQARTAKKMAKTEEITKSMDDEAVVEKVSDEQIEIIGSHKAGLLRIQQMTDSALLVIEQSAIDPDLPPEDKAKLALVKINACATAANTYKTLIPAQRQAYGLDKGTEGNPYDMLIRLMHGITE